MLSQLLFSWLLWLHFQVLQEVLVEKYRWQRSDQNTDDQAQTIVEASNVSQTLPEVVAISFDDLFLRRNVTNVYYTGISDILNLGLDLHLMRHFEKLYLLCRMVERID